jgi:hypothetical protein
MLLFREHKDCFSFRHRLTFEIMITDQLSEKYSQTTNNMAV